jgi:CheY-like chemotaxis protein
MDGVSATVAIRGLTGDRARTPIIALTANTIDGDRERYIEAGMNGYLSKPVTFSALKAALERAAGPIGLSAHGS